MRNNNYETILNRIKKNKDDNRLSHAFIVHGAGADRRKIFARDAVKMILGDDERTSRKIDDGNCEDLLIIKKDGDSVKVAQIESMIASFKNKPFTSDVMVAIIEDGDCITEHSQNKLLKTLEEPSPGYVIIILVSNPELLAETIRSRCVIIKIQDEILSIDTKCLEDAKNILSMTLFQNVALNNVFDEMHKYEERYPELLTAMKTFLRDIVVGTRNEQLIVNKDNKEIVSKLNKNIESRCRKSIYIIEDTSVMLAKGMNEKYSMRDMAVRIRQEANNG